MGRYNQSSLILKKIEKNTKIYLQYKAILLLFAERSAAGDDYLPLILYSSKKMHQCLLEVERLQVERPLVFGKKGLDRLIEEFPGGRLFEELRFDIDDIRMMSEILLGNNPVVLPNKHGKISAIDAVAVTLFRLSKQTPLSRMEQYCGYPDFLISTLTIRTCELIGGDIFNRIMDYPCWIDAEKLEYYNKAIEEKRNGTNDLLVGFVDGTHREIAVPAESQRQFYNGWLHSHSISFMAVSFPDGSFVLRGPETGNNNDLHNYVSTGMEQIVKDLILPYKIGGDSIFYSSTSLLSLREYKKIASTQDVNSFCSTRVTVEWLFADIANTFKHVQYIPDMRIDSGVGLLYRTSAIFTLIRTSLYGSKIQRYFGVECVPIKAIFPWYYGE